MTNIFKNSNKPFIKIKQENITPIISALSISFLIFVVALTKNNQDKPEKHNIFSNKSSENHTSRSNINYQKNRPTYVEGQVVVKYKDSEIKLFNSDDKSEANQIAKSANLKKIGSVKDMNVETYKISDSKSVEEKIEELKKDDRVEYVEPNYIYYPTYTPNDTNYHQQWALENTGQSFFGNTGTEDADMDVNDMWDIETKHKSDIVVAVIDTGVVINHADIKENLMPGVDFLGSGEPYDTDGHGSHVAGIIASVVDNSKGISGISRYNNVKVLPIRAGDSDGFNLTEVLLSISYAKTHGAKIINMSFGSPSYSQNLKDAIEEYPGLVVAAAGNGGVDGIGDNNDTTPEYPASYNLPNIISVASTNQHDNLSAFSNYGVKSVDIGAPGENILSLEGKRVLDIDFDNLVPPSIGDLEVSGTYPNWGTIEYGSGNVALITDINVAIPSGTTIPSGTYASEANSYIKFPNIVEAHDPKYRHVYISFFYTCSLPESGVGGLPKLSLEKHYEGTWETFFTNEGTTPYGYVTVDISGNYDQVYTLGFRWQTPSVNLGNYDPTIHYGCIIDDIKIVDSGAADGSYQLMDGTSMASPYAAAVAAIIWGKNPNLSPEDVKRIVLETGDDVGDLGGKILTGKRVNAFKAYHATPSFDGDDNDDPTFKNRVVFHPDTRCHWKKPEPIERIEIKPAEKNGVKGMQLTWVQVDADRVDIEIDDGTGKYPWKISNTENDGHEFLANVAPWQNIIIKPTNHCKRGESSIAINLNKYPYGWHKNTALATITTNPVQGSTSNNIAQNKTQVQNNVLGESTQSVPETGSEELLFIVISSILTGMGAYYIHNGKSRKLALKDFEKKSTDRL